MASTLLTRKGGPSGKGRREKTRRETRPLPDREDAGEVAGEDAGEDVTDA